MKLLKHNWQWKLISLVIGALMWSYITAGVNPTQSLTVNNIPIVVQNQEELSQHQLQITKMEFDQISIRLTGKRNALGNLDRTNVTATIDASQLREGTQPIAIEIHAPMNLLIDDTTSQQMQVTVEKVVKKSREVVIEQSGKLDPEYVLQSVMAVPESIEVSGPRSLVDRVTQIVTQMNLNGLTGDTSANIEVMPVDREGNLVEGVELSLASVNVTASIAMQKSLPIVLAKTGESPEGTRIQQATVSPDTVLVMGKKDVLEKLDEIQTMPLDRAKVDHDGLYSVTLDYPSGVLPVNSNAKFQAQISLEKRENRTFEVPLASVQFKNGEKFTARVEDEKAMISVVVTGYAKDLDTLQPSDIQLTADLSGKSAGTQNISIEATAPETFEVQSLSPVLVPILLIDSESQ